jgi:hypothetical protein
MGADLICYMVKGPEDLDESKRDEAIQKVDKFILDVRSFLDAQEKGETTEEHRLYFADLEEWDLEKIADSEAEEIVDELFAAWNGDYRDTSHRPDPDDKNQRFVVAGEMSWGDEPSGGGYQGLKMAEKVGLFEFFGLR